VQRAVEDALARAPGAHALIDVSYGMRQLCMVVKGTAVRVP
jgi:hypothetical protein